MKTTLKNITRLSGLAMMAFLTIQCDKNEVDDKPTQFDLPAIKAEFPDIIGTKSTKALVSADGIVTCDAADVMKVFVETQGVEVSDWEAVTQKYLTNSADCGAGLFKPETPMVLENLDAKINLYVMNPWNDLVTDPIGGEDSYSEFSFEGQIQDENDLTAHLSNYALLTGVAKNVVAGQTPEIKLEHKSALLKFTIENQLRRPLSLKAVEILAPEGVNIGGTYSVDFNPGAALTPVTPSNKVLLTIRNGKTLQADENAEIFVMTPPFSLKAGQVIKLQVTSSEGVWTKNVVIEQDMDIKAGSLNTTTVERDKFMVENIWSKTHTTLNLQSVNALGVAINKDYMFIQEYDSRCHLYKRDTGEYLKEVIQGGPYSFMLNADVDDAGHFISSRHNVYGAGFIVFRYDVDTDQQIELLNFTAGDGCPEDMGYGLNVSGDVTKGKSFIYGTAGDHAKIYYWELNDGKLVTPAGKPQIIQVPDSGDSWVISNIDRATLDSDSDHYVSYLQEGETEDQGGSKFLILDKDLNIVATLDPANTLYRILDFKVFNMGKKTLLVTTEQGFARWDGVRMQIFDITDRENLKLKPGDAGYEKFLLYTSSQVGVTNYNRWGNASVYVDNDQNEAYLTSGAVGNADQPTSVRLFKLKLFE